jgi:hypothetical protein
MLGFGMGRGKELKGRVEEENERRKEDEKTYKKIVEKTNFLT